MRKARNTLRDGTGALAQDRSPEIGPPLRELLDHLAQELAAEYVRLLRQDASQSAEPGQNGGAKS